MATQDVVNSTLSSTNGTTIVHLTMTPEEQAVQNEKALILFGSLFLSQFLVMFWKSRHPSSYHIASLGGLWLIPMWLGLKAGNFRFLIIWLKFSVINIGVIQMAFKKPMKKETPGMVYRWFAGVYTVSYTLGLIGYGMIMMAIFRVIEIFGFSEKSDVFLFGTGIYFMFYGIYFGVLGRDIIDRLSDMMATSLGYYNRTGFPSKHLRETVCAICGGDTSSAEFVISLRDESDTQPLNQNTTGIMGYLSLYGRNLSPNESSKIFRLDCNHLYHEPCLRGWTLIGKKDMCPYCKEKVDLKLLKGNNPWDTTQEIYLGILDACRYILVWNPIVLIFVNVLFGILGLNK